MIRDEQIIRNAKTLAKYQQYPRLINGLQPLDSYELDGKTYLGLFAKLGNEMVEFFDALEHKTAWHVLHEVCDLYYYSVQIEYQMSMTYNTHINMWTPIKDSIEEYLPQFVNPDVIRAMARAKFAFRAQAIGNKNELYEIELMKKAASQRS